NVGLTHVDRSGVRVPRLARAVPTTDNGLWLVLPDGSMEITWNIRPEAQWHDGAPLTSADLLFTAQLERDPSLPVLLNRLWDGVAGLEAPDAHTIVARWKRPYINADEMFTYRFPSPLPPHALEK